MSFVAAKCTECGANIEVDDSKDAGICRHCGTAFVTQKVISNNNTYITKNVTKHIYGKEKPESEEHIVNGELFLKLKDFEKATKAFTLAAETNPNDYRCWLGLARSETQEFTHPTNTSYETHLTKAYAVATSDEKKTIDVLFEKYISNRKRIAALSEQMQPILKKHGKITKPVAICAFIFLCIGVFLGVIALCLLSWELGIPALIILAIGGLLAVADALYTKHVNKASLSPYNNEIIRIEKEMKESK